MKYLILLMVGLFSLAFWLESENIQERNPVNWGEKIRLAPSFAFRSTTEQTKLRQVAVDDSLYAGAQDTLYSDALYIDGDTFDGIFHVVFYPEQLVAGGDSIFLEIRFGENFKHYDEGQKNKIVWDSTWKPLLTAAANVKSELYIAQSDCTWWNPAAIRQYRIRKTDADGSQERAWLTDYIR